MSAVIGIELDTDTLVLTRGRDFKWQFENIDEDKNPVPFPDGDLFFELKTGGQHNAIQRVLVSEATDGTYALSFDGETTSPIDFYDVTENPHGLAGDVTDALEALSTIGPGNVDVRPAKLIPFWELNLTLNQSDTLSEQLVNVLNKEINNFFNTFDSLLGVDIDFVIHDNLNATVKVSSLKSFTEVSLITFAVDVTSTAVKSFLNGVADLTGVIDTVSVDFYWNRSYDVEFVGDLAETEVPVLVPDTGNLQGQGDQDVTVTVVKPGKARLTIWQFDISGSLATLKVESEEADLIAHRTDWQLVFLPDGEPAGGDPVALGRVYVQGD